MEKYLIEQYDVLESEYIEKEEDIIPYFEDDGHLFFDCGEGYYEDEVDLICKVGNKFYLVEIEAEVYGHWQDRGDKVYKVENITSVKYKEIEKPKEKTTTKLTYHLTLSKEQRTALNIFLSENEISYEVQ